MNAKCPRCQKMIPEVIARNMPIKSEVGTNVFQGVAMTCPECNTILSVSVDPLALGRETVAAVVQALKTPPPEQPKA